MSQEILNQKTRKFSKTDGFLSKGHKSKLEGTPQTDKILDNLSIKRIEHNWSKDPEYIKTLESI